MLQDLAEEELGPIMLGIIKQSIWCGMLYDLSEIHENHFIGGRAHKTHRAARKAA